MEIYKDQWDKGNYTCSKCGHILFSSGDKFDSGTRWPSFRKTMKEGARYETQVTYDQVQPKKLGNTNLNGKQIHNLLKNAKEDKEVENLYKKDVERNIIGKALKTVKRFKGYDAEKMPDYYTQLDLPEHVMAATIKTYDPTTNSQKVILAYNSKYMGQLRKNPLKRLYVNLHEHGHVGGEHSESKTEGLVRDAANVVLGQISSAKDMTKNAYDSVKQALSIGHLAQKREYLQHGH